ncbi:MAG: substrate-binding domain-containing protein [Bacteroidales bacterium]
MIGFNRIKKLIFILFALIIVAIGCKEEEKKVKIGFLMDSFAVARWKRDFSFFEERVKKLGGDVVVKSADGNDLTQLNQAIELLDQEVDILVVVAVNSNTAAAIVREAHKRSVKVIAYARIINNCDLDYYTTFNVEKIGELQANFITSRIPNGRFILINGDIADINAVKEYNGVRKVLDPMVDSKKAKIIYSGFMDSWSGDEAAFTVNEIIGLYGKNFDAIFVANDGMAKNVIEVLRQKNLAGKVLVTGLDAEAGACRMILSGEQSMTVYMSIKQLAYKSAELAMEVARKSSVSEKLGKINNGRNDIPSLMLDPVAVDKDNLETTVIADGFLTMEEIQNSEF